MRWRIVPSGAIRVPVKVLEYSAMRKCCRHYSRRLGFHGSRGLTNHQLNFRQSAETVEEPGLDERQPPLWSLHYLHDVVL